MAATYQQLHCPLILLVELYLYFCFISLSIFIILLFYSVE